MSMYTRPVTCTTRGCTSNAEYKVAANWNAGRFSELKTYGLACEAHHTQCFREALQRRKVHPPSPEEVQGEIALYRYEKGKHDRQLEKLPNPS